MDDGPALAAANNAEWCDHMCRSHGVHTTSDAQAWSTRSRSPRFYPDAVTLSRDAVVADLLSRVDAGPGCSIKDSFACLDLATHGFRVLFEAQWIALDSRPSALDDALAWEVVDDGPGLARWEEAWRAGEGEPGLFRPDLLDQPAVTVVAGHVGADLVAGAVLNETGPVVGITNFFPRADHAGAARRGCAAFVARRWSGLDVCGYESGDDLVDARRAGFAEVGPLRVWIRDD